MSDEVREEVVSEAAPNYTRLPVEVEVKASNKQTREILHIISAATPDRAGDVVEPGGAVLDNYLKNPIVLRDHSYRTEDIIGRAVSIEVQKGAIYARTQFRDTLIGQDAFALASEKLGGWSIGFRPVEYDAMKDEKGRHNGFRFKKWELLEYSLVAVPMHQEAVNQAVHRGLVHAENVARFFVVDGEQPPAQSASQGSTAVKLDTHPAMLAIESALRRFGRADSVRDLTERLRNLS